MELEYITFKNPKTIAQIIYSNNAPVPFKGCNIEIYYLYQIIY